MDTKPEAMASSSSSSSSSVGENLPPSATTLDTASLGANDAPVADMCSAVRITLKLLLDEIMRAQNVHAIVTPVDACFGSQGWRLEDQGGSFARLSAHLASGWQSPVLWLLSLCQLQGLQTGFLMPARIVSTVLHTCALFEPAFLAPISSTHVAPRSLLPGSDADGRLSPSSPSSPLSSETSCGERHDQDDAPPQQRALTELTQAILQKMALPKWTGPSQQTPAPSSASTEAETPMATAGGVITAPMTDGPQAIALLTSVLEQLLDRFEHPTAVPNLGCSSAEGTRLAAARAVHTVLRMAQRFGMIDGTLADFSRPLGPRDPLVFARLYALLQWLQAEVDAGRTSL